MSWHYSTRSFSALFFLKSSSPKIQKWLAIFFMSTYFNSVFICLKNRKRKMAVYCLGKIFYTHAYNLKTKNYFLWKVYGHFFFDYDLLILFRNKVSMIIIGTTRWQFSNLIIAKVFLGRDHKDFAGHNTARDMLNTWKLSVADFRLCCYEVFNLT